MTLTCITCKVLFSDPENQREHYKSEWHRYNLKRKVAELPTITKEEFEEKVKIYQFPSEDNVIKASKCEVCSKHFSSQNALENHLKSKRHLNFRVLEHKKLSKKEGREPLSWKKANVTASLNRVDLDGNTEELNAIEWSDDDSDDGWESIDDDDEACDPVNCLFCPKVSDSFSQNLKHMSASHSFFIPFVEYLTDLKGLITYLHEKVNEAHLCLWCNAKGKFFKSTMAAQMHMMEKGHCKMLYEDEFTLEFERFYDYSSIDTGSEKQDEDEEILDGSGYELRLPSGKTIGHRSLLVYYHQNLKPQNSGNQKQIKKLVDHYKALGWTGTTGEKAKQRARDLTRMRNLQNKHLMRLGVKANKFQPHFRMQVMF